MKETIIHPGPRAELIESPIPKPQAQQVVIKVLVTSINQKDWKVSMDCVTETPQIQKIHIICLTLGFQFPDWTSTSINQGDDIAGTIHAVGRDVLEIKPGDRVAALHELGAPGGSYAEYATAWDYTTFHIPSRTSFEGACVPPLPNLLPHLPSHLSSPHVHPPLP